MMMISTRGRPISSRARPRGHAQGSAAGWPQPAAAVFAPRARLPTAAAMPLRYSTAQ